MSLETYTNADIMPPQQPLSKINDISEIELQQLTADLEGKKIVDQFAKTEKVNVQILDQSSMQDSRIVAESREESQKGEIFITRPLLASVEEKMPAMPQLDIEFMSKVGRAISPLEANPKATDESFGMNDSEHDQLF